jgi:signal transduction histidine kinase/ActR/RegA family two-component response regulator
MRGADMYDGAWDVVAPEEAIAIRAERPDPRTGVRGLNRDVRIIRPDGEERWIHCTATTTPEGRLVGLVMDVTQRKRQEIELAAARARAEAAVEAQSRFLASMSHEIRTPLNGVLAMAAAMERTPLQVDQKRMVAVMTSSGRQLLAMLDDVLDLAKIEADRLRLDLAPFDAAASVEAVAALFREAATAKGLTMWVDVAPNARGLFVGDALRVRQVLQNFVANAIKFTEAGDIAIRLTHSRGRLRFSVEDTGIGIDAAKASRLFERFAQADESITRRFGGTGLGLAIARELAHLMGGDVGVDSAPGAGATFWFEAPFAPAADCAQPPQARPARILAAEDNPANRLVLETLLRQADLSADFVENGAAAVDAARAIAYDLVLMDLHMPGMDGIEAARAIRALDGPNADIPILALTASAQPDTIAACLAAGMNGHVAKPITPATLYAAIAEALGAEPPPALAPAAAAG